MNCPQCRTPLVEGRCPMVQCERYGKSYCPHGREDGCCLTCASASAPVTRCPRCGLLLTACSEPSCPGAERTGKPPHGTTIDDPHHEEGGVCTVCGVPIPPPEDEPSNSPQGSTLSSYVAGSENPSGCPHHPDRSDWDWSLCDRCLRDARDVLYLVHKLATCAHPKHIEQTRAAPTMRWCPACGAMTTKRGRWVLPELAEKAKALDLAAPSAGAPAAAAAGTNREEIDTRAKPGT